MAIEKTRKQLHAEGRERPKFTGKARPHYVSEMDVLQAARNRMKWLFDEFDGKVAVSCSGGKDSTIILELAAEQARERGEKLRVVFIDQEAEFQGTIDYMRGLKERDDIALEWYQIPFKLFNATNHDNEWLMVWGEGEEWMRPMEPDSIQDVRFYRKDGSVVDRWMEIVHEVNKATGGAIVIGMRAEESPTRRVFMVSNPAYKWVTWSSGGKELGPDGKPFYSFNPIWDWTYRDVWKAINDHGWTYNSYYDKQFQLGVPIRNMRVSSFHHSQAIGSLTTLQEAEPETWEAAVRRLDGISTFGHIGRMSEQVPSLPYMFRDWEEYMHYLIDNLVDERHRGTFRKMYASMVEKLPSLTRDRIAHQMLSSVINNDYTGKSNEQFLVVHGGEQKREKERLRLREETIKEQEEAFG